MEIPLLINLLQAERYLYPQLFDEVIKKKAGEGEEWERKGKRRKVKGARELRNDCEQGGRILWMFVGGGYK